MTTTQICDNCGNPVRSDTERPYEWIHEDGYYRCHLTNHAPTDSVATVAGSTLVPEPKPTRNQIDGIVLSAVDAERILKHYDDIVRANYSPDYNTIRHVFIDSSGEAAWEIVETAADLGFHIQRDEGPGEALFNAIWDLYPVYRDRILNDPLNVPIEGEDD